MDRTLQRLEGKLREYLNGLGEGPQPEPLPPLPLPEEVKPDTWQIKLSRIRLMRLIAMISHYRAKGEFTETGNMLDDYAVTEDEEDIISVLLDSALNAVWMKVARMSKHTQEAFTYSPEEDAWSMKFEPADNYDQNILGILRDVCEAYIVWKVLFDWWKVKGYDRGSQMALVTFAECEDRLLDCVHWRKRFIQRPGSVF